MPLDVITASVSAKTLLLALIRDDKTLPAALILAGILIVVHHARKPPSPIHVEPVGTTFLTETGF
jgi:hypothetical protein